MRKWLFLLTCVLLAGCGNTENEFTVGTCILIIDNSVHQDATLASAMNPAAPGTFCTITTTMKGGAESFVFTNSAGQTSSKILNAIDKKRTMIIGYNNGIIVGFGTLNIPAVFYAFVRSKPLSVSTNGLASCAVCHRQYDLNNDGFISSGEPGKRLTRYHAATTGPFGVLSVN